MIKKNSIAEALESLDKALKIDPNYGKALCSRFHLNYESEKYIEAKDDFEKLKVLDPQLFADVAHLEASLNIRFEEAKLKLGAETMEKLKEVGNSFLGLFGLSTDNFKMNEQPGGGYNISFQK